MRHASLFSGIGGPEVAAAMLGWENVFHCEINPFGRAVLEYWFPESVSYEDITKTSFKEWRGRVDVLTGGFPCQPFSYAGKRGGRDDDRYLWPEMLRAIDEIRPTWVIGENVAGITTMVEGGVCADLGCDSSLFAEGDDLHRYELDRTFTIERICRDLEHLGYSVQPMLVPAAAVGAPHRRDRVFIVAFDADPDRGDDAGRPGCVPHSCGTQPLQERDEVRESGVATDIRSALQRLAEDSVGIRRDGGERQDEPRSGGQRKSCTGDNERVCGESWTHPSNPASDGRDGCEGTTYGRGPSCKDGKRLSTNYPQGDGFRCIFGCSCNERPSADAEKRFRDGGIIGRTGSRRESESKPGSGYRKNDVAHTDSRGSDEVHEHIQPGVADGDEPVRAGGEWTPTDTDGKGREESFLPGRRENSEEDGAGVHDRVERSGRDGATPDSVLTGLEREDEPRRCKGGERMQVRGDTPRYDWESLRPENRWSGFPAVSPVHRGNDGIPIRLDNLSISFTQWRTESLKAYGNAIVPQVMYRLFQAIQSISNQ